MKNKFNDIIKSFKDLYMRNLDFRRAFNLVFLYTLPSIEIIYLSPFHLAVTTVLVVLYQAVVALGILFLDIKGVFDPSANHNKMSREPTEENKEQNMEIHKDKNKENLPATDLDSANRNRSEELISSSSSVKEDIELVKQPESNSQAKVVAKQ